MGNERAESEVLTLLVWSLGVCTAVAFNEAAGPKDVACTEA